MNILEHIRKYLLQHPEVRCVWMDFWCLPQKQALDRTEDEELEFRLGLGSLWMIFIESKEETLKNLC